MRKIRDLNPGDLASSISAAKYNLRNEEIERRAKLQSSGGLFLSQGPSGFSINREYPGGGWARISGSGNPYTFQWVSLSQNGTWVVVDPGSSLSGVHAYEANSVPDLDQSVQWLYPFSPTEYRFQDVACCPYGYGYGYIYGVADIPNCYCTNIPETLSMTSFDESCNFQMFQSCTIQYGPTQTVFANLSLGDNCFLSTESFPDPVAGGARFYYYLTCQFNQFVLSRVYPTSPFGSPYRDGILYTWLIGGYGNSCHPFTLDNGRPFPGSDASCRVNIDAA